MVGRRGGDSLFPWARWGRDPCPHSGWPSRRRGTWGAWATRKILDRIPSWTSGAGCGSITTPLGYPRMFYELELRGSQTSVASSPILQVQVPDEHNLAATAGLVVVGVQVHLSKMTALAMVEPVCADVVVLGLYLEPHASRLPGIQGGSPKQLSSKTLSAPFGMNS